VKALPEEATEKGMPDATDPRGDAADAAIGRERGRRLQGYLLRLSVPIREALVLRFYEGLSFEDIASVTGDKLSSAKMKVYRGLEKIRAMMEADGFVDDETRS
jgi:RNA polymerase sigma-70 factor (ECF subfamily)